MEKKLALYAQLIVKQGINLEKGEMLGVACDIECVDLAREIAKCAYKLGARRVIMYFSDSLIGKYALEYQADEDLSVVPDYVVASRDYLIDNKGAFISIISERPDLLKDINPEKIRISTISASKALTRFRESTGSNKTRWCLCAYPNLEWAEKVFPNLKGEKAIEKMWEYIFKALRMDTDDALKAWKQHEESLDRRSKILNEANIVSLHYKNSIGTDFTVGLPKNYRFTGANEHSFDGRPFTANLPTEEVFTSPDRNVANGKLVASLPLVRRGKVIKDFFMEFKDGKCINFGASEGYETLKGLIETDEGSHYLGEVALVGYNSPIQNLKTLFYNTLFDENASCHFAIGRGFGACIKNGNEMTKEQLKELGINDSIEHADFMIGTSDLSIIATKANGEKMEIFKNGDWVF